MQAQAGVVKIMISVGRCPAIDEDGERCKDRASEMARVQTQWGSTYLRACPFHADRMEDE
jgi:hypothetical protein